VATALAGAVTRGGGGGGGGAQLVPRDGPTSPSIIVGRRAESIFAASTQLGQWPAASRQVAQMGFRQPVHWATDGTA